MFARALPPRPESRSPAPEERRALRHTHRWAVKRKRRVPPTHLDGDDDHQDAPVALLQGRGQEGPASPHQQDDHKENGALGAACASRGTSAATKEGTMAHVPHIPTQLHASPHTYTSKNKPPGAEAKKKKEKGRTKGRGVDEEGSHGKNVVRHCESL